MTHSRHFFTPSPPIEALFWITLRLLRRKGSDVSPCLGNWPGAFHVDFVGVHTRVRHASFCALTLTSRRLISPFPSVPSFFLTHSRSPRPRAHTHTHTQKKKKASNNNRRLLAEAGKPSAAAAPAVAPAPADASSPPPFKFKASTPAPLAPVVFIDPALAPPDHEKEEDAEAAGNEGKSESQQQGEKLEDQPDESAPKEVGPPTGSQPAVNSLGDAPGICVQPGSPLIQLLGAVGNININATEYQPPLPLSAKADKAKLPNTPRQAGWKAPRWLKPSSCSAKQYRDIVAEIFKKDVDLELPGALRLAFHNCGNFVVLDASGGCDGAWIRFAPDAEVPANGGSIKTSVEALEKVKKKFPCITYSDLYTLAGSAAVEVAGGPPVAWQPGRIDAEGPGPAHPPFSSRLPDGMFNGAGLAYFMSNWGFTPRETVAIIGGGHSIGGASTDASGWSLTFTPSGDDWPVPSNKYFVQLLNSSWIEATAPETGLPQYVLPPSDPESGAAGSVEGKPIGRLPSDMAMRFTKIYADSAAGYAADEELFKRDFSLALQKLLALGSPGVGKQGGNFKWKGLGGKWEGLGPDAAFEQLPQTA